MVIIMNEHPIGEMMENVMGKIREMVDVSAVVGDPINTVDGMTVIPISKLSFGFASGGSDFTGKHQQSGQKNPFGGGVGAGVKITPMAFMVVNEGSVRLMTIEPPATTTLDRVVESAPEIIDKVKELFKKEAKKKEEV